MFIRSTWDYTGRRDAFLRWAATICKVTTLICPLPLLQWNTTKAYLADLAAAGVPIIPTKWLTEPGVDLSALLAQAGWTEGLTEGRTGPTSETSTSERRPRGTWVARGWRGAKPYFVCVSRCPDAS